MGVGTDPWNCGVSIRAVAGTKIYMDMPPFPFPVRKIERDKDIISWECTFIENATAAALETLWLTFTDVLVDINDGHGEYLCRWGDGMAEEFIRSAKVSKSCKFSFTIIDTRTSGLIIYDANGSNGVTLDFEPYPFPEPVQQKDGTQKISFSTIYISRTKADLIKAKYPLDVRVKLKTAGSTYLCRFDNCEVVLLTKNECSLKCDFTVLQIVGGSASSQVIIYDSAGANAVTLWANPFPKPKIKKERRISSRDCCPGLSGATVTPGERIHFDGGVHISTGVIEFEVPYILEASRVILSARFDNLANCRVSIDGGTTKYNCIFAEYEEIGLGDPSVGLRMRFLIISTV